METSQQYTVETFATGERRTVTAADWWNALEGQPDHCFLIVRRHDGRYAARTLENGVFPVAGEHIADTAQAAADSLRQAYKTLKATAA